MTIGTWISGEEKNFDAIFDGSAEYCAKIRRGSDNMPQRKPNECLSKGFAICQKRKEGKELKAYYAFRARNS